MGCLLMNKWKFYLSGILYGEINQDGDNIMHIFHDPFSGECLECVPLENGDAYKPYCQRDVFSILRNMYEYESAVKKGVEFTTTFGERYTKKGEYAFIERDKKFAKEFLHDESGIYAVLMAGRDYTAVLIREGREKDTILSDWSEYNKKELFRIKKETFFVETRDGEKLATDIYLPITNEKVPTILVRTPYGKGNGCELMYRFVQRGYALAVQDVRGREDSTGEWLPCYYEMEDGDDAINAVVERSHSDGQVAMMGGSYLGYVQWAAAASGNEHLKAMLSNVTAGGPFVDLPRRGGSLLSGTMAWAFAMSEQRMRADLMVRDDWDEVLAMKPISSIPKKALGYEVSFLSKWFANKDGGEFWNRCDWQLNSKGLVVPTFLTSGWFDDDSMGSTQALELMAKYPKGNSKVLLGPWMHSGNANYDIHNMFMGDDALRYDIDLMQLMWLNHFLLGEENGIEKTPEVEYYTLGENKWKSAPSWFDIGENLTMYLFGDATDKVSGGSLLMSVADDEKSTFLYDPENPSTHIIDVSENENSVPADYSEEEKRADMLVYSTEPLDEDFIITGDVIVNLYLSSDCPDTDLVVRICDVDESGRSIKLADGNLTVKYRNSYDRAEFMHAGEVYRVSIRTTKFSNTFKKGHKIRLTVTSSAKNFIFPNSNTENGYDSDTVRVATNSIHSGRLYPSSIIMRRE